MNKSTYWCSSWGWLNEGAQWFTKTTYQDIGPLQKRWLTSLLYLLSGFRISEKWIRMPENSFIFLKTQLTECWSDRGVNQRPSARQTDAYPAELKRQSALRPKFGPAASLSVRTANDRAHLKLVSTLSWWLTEYLKKMKKLLSNNNNNNNNSNKKKKNDK